MMKTWVRYTLIGAISLAVIGGTTFGVQRWAYSKGVKEIQASGPAELEAGLGHLKLAHALRNPNAAYEIGRCYWDNKRGIQNWNTAVEWFQKAVERGNAKAQTKLSSAYFLGWGVPINSSEGMKCLQKAADQGDAEAQCGIGYYYYHGQYVPQNYGEGVRWYQKAADQGNANAQYMLGNAYINGQGVSQNFSESARWYQKAANQGHNAAQCALGDGYYFGQGVTLNYAEAVKWYQKAAEQGHVGAQYMLGWCYNLGRGVPKNPSEAVKWLQKSAEQGEDRAQYALGIFYFLGVNVPHNPSEAVKWFQKSADQENEEARKILPSALAIASKYQQAAQSSPIQVEGLGVVNDSGYLRIRGTVLNTNSGPMDAFIDMELVRADGVVVEQFSKTCYQVPPGGRQLIDIAIAPYHANTRVRLRDVKSR